MDYNELAKKARKEVGKTPKDSGDTIATRIVDGLSTRELREIAYSVIITTINDELRKYQMAIANGGAMGKQFAVSPRDTRQTVERGDVRQAEKRTLVGLDKAVTTAQKAAYFMELAPKTYRVPHVGPVLGRDMTKQHWIAWRERLRGRILGHQKSIEVVDKVLDFLNETGANTLDEAFKKAQKKSNP